MKTSEFDTHNYSLTHNCNSHSHTHKQMNIISKLKLNLNSNRFASSWNCSNSFHLFNQNDFNGMSTSQVQMTTTSSSLLPHNHYHVNHLLISNRNHLAEHVFFSQHRPLGLGSMPVLDINPASNQMHHQWEEDILGNHKENNTSFHVDFVDKYDHIDNNQNGMLYCILIQ